MIKSRFFHAALAILLLAERANAQVFVCGNSYTEASENCTGNIPCPSGDGCPDNEGICFAVPVGSCFDPPTKKPTMSPTKRPLVPSASPTPSPLRICGIDYAEALLNCKTSDQCPNGDAAICGDNRHACFAIPWDMCDSQPTVSPTLGAAPIPVTPKVCGTSASDAQAKCTDMSKRCPSGECFDTGEACFNVPANVCGVMSDPTKEPTKNPTPSPSVAVTVAANLVPQQDAGAAPAPGPLSICGSDYSNVIANCRTNPKCPTGDGCPDNGICYTLPADSCPSATTAANSGSGPLSICGSDYTDATQNCRTNPTCPSGDGCPDNGTCFSLPPGSCPEQTIASNPTIAAVVTMSPIAMSPITMSPTTDSPTTSASPSVAATVQEQGVEAPEPAPGPLTICGRDYTDVIQNCRTNPSCPTGDGCPNNGICYTLPPGSCPEPTTSNPTTITAIVTNSPTMKQTNMSPITMNPTMKQTTMVPNPTMSPMANVPTVQTNEPTPARQSICGDGYTDASDNFCTNPRCPSGDGCPDGMVCFSLPSVDCTVSTASSPPTAGAQDVPPGDTQQLSTDPTVSPTPNPSLSPSVGGTKNPTGSPIFNKFFCGVDSDDAEQNCWVNEACPSGVGCPSGQACFGITMERCLSPAPTDSPTGPGPRPSASPTISSTPTASPTTSMIPTKTPTLSPSKAPVINTSFCGINYVNALNMCSEQSACPSLSGCPGGQTCFTNIQCPGPAPTTTAAPVAFDPNNTLYCGVDYDDAIANCYDRTPCPNGTQEACPTGQGCYPIASCPIPAPTTPPPAPGQVTIGMPGDDSMETYRPTTVLEGIFRPTPNPAPWPSSEQSFLRYCGLNAVDAMERCATTAPCPDGMSDNCLPGQSCFPIPQACVSGISGMNPQPTPITLPTTPMPQSMTNNFQPTTPITQPTPFFPVPDPTTEPVPFDPNNTRYCGADYNDADDNCYKQTPCPNGNGDCPNGGTCYTINKCLTPQPTVSPAPTISGGIDATGSPTMRPTDKPASIKPTWNFENISPASSSPVMQSVSLIVKSLVLGGAILGVIVL